jgi:hypothetical protein
MLPGHLKHDIIQTVECYKIQCQLKSYRTKNHQNNQIYMHKSSVIDEGSCSDVFVSLSEAKSHLP